MKHITFPIAVELLENRRLLSATTTLVDGVLTVTGSERADGVYVALSGQDSSQLIVVADGEAHTIAVSDITSIKINTLGGNDKIVVSEKNGRLFLPIEVNAGAGNDLVITGSGDDVIDGGDGKDKITAGAGDDQITGGAGNDTIVGGDDNDTITAGDGKDKLDGGAGDDNLDGGAGKDSVKTGAGDDAVAVDTTNLKEVRDRKPGQDHEYRVADLADLSADIRTLHETVIPGSQVFRVEITDGIVTMYYRFGSDPKAYKTVVDATGTELELVSREISLEEVRTPALTAFEQRHPGVEVKGVQSESHGKCSIRYRDTDGTLKTAETDDLIWTLDDADQDANNDGISDHHGGPDDGGGQQGGPQDGGGQHGGPQDGNNQGPGPQGPGPQGPGPQGPGDQGGLDQPGGTNQQNPGDTGPMGPGDPNAPGNNGSPNDIPLQV